MTKDQLQILQHSLGVDQFGRGKQYRNHFCAGGDDEPICRELVAMGFMETFTRSSLPYYNCRVTDAGVAAMYAASPNPPKKTRSQARYLEWLDADADLPFGEWLRQRKDVAL